MFAIHSELNKSKGRRRVDRKNNKDEQEFIDLLAGKNQSKKTEESSEEYIRRLLQEEEKAKEKAKEKEIEEQKKTTPKQKKKQEKIAQETLATVTISDSIAKPSKKKKRREKPFEKVQEKTMRAIDKKGKTLENFLKEKQKEIKKKIIFFISLFFAFLVFLLPMMVGFEKAKAEILAQLEEIKHGNITDEEIDSTMMALDNAVLQIGDTPSSYIGWYFDCFCDSDLITPEEHFRRFREVTKERIIEAAKSLKLDTIYLMLSKEAEDK